MNSRNIKRLDKECVTAKLRKSGTVDCSSRQHISHIDENVDAIESLVMSQDNMIGYVK